MVFVNLFAQLDSNQAKVDVCLNHVNLVKHSMKMTNVSQFVVKTKSMMHQVVHASVEMASTELREYVEFAQKEVTTISSNWSADHYAHSTATLKTEDVTATLVSI